MFIVHGTKRVVRKLGFVADFCPICRDLRVFQLSRIGLAGHIYYISFGSGTLAGHTIECIECGIALSTDPMQYGAPQKQKDAGLETIIENTFPRVREVHAERLALENSLKQRQTIPQEKRASLIIEPFRLLNPQVDARFNGSTEFDKQSGIGCLGTILLSFALFVLALNLPVPRQDGFLAIAAGAGVGGLIYTFVQLWLAPRRYLKAKIVPMLARSLHPLRATDNELSDCLHKCKILGLTIGEKLKMEVLCAEILRVE